MMTYFALTNVTDSGGFIDGIVHVYNTVPERFTMIVSKGEIINTNGQDTWENLPGIAVLVGGMWVANLYYWGFNQYIIQRTLAAKNLREGQKGIAFAAFLKLLMPIIVVVPGIVAYVMNMDAGVFNSSTVDPSFVSENGLIANDNAAPWLIKNFIPSGFLGLILAALAAAIVSSLASMLNSTSTIFTMDIYKSFINKKATDKSMVRVDHEDEIYRTLDEKHAAIVDLIQDCVKQKQPCLVGTVSIEKSETSDAISFFVTLMATRLNHLVDFSTPLVL